MKRILLILTAVFLFASSLALAEEMRFEASLERDRVAVGNSLYLYVAFYGARDVEPPEVPQRPGLQVKYVGPSTKLSVVQGKVSRSVTHTYLVIPRKKGEFKIGPFFAEYRGRTYKADAVVLAVYDVPPAAGVPGPSPAPPVTTAPRAIMGERVPYMGDRIFLTMDIGKRLVYINEVVPVTIKIHVERGLGLKEIEYPGYSHEGFSAGEFEEPERRTELVRGVRYDVLVFRQDLFGIKEGDYVLGPAKLKCKLVTREAPSRRSSIFGRSVFDDDFFAGMFGQRTYPVELESKELPVSVLPFPEEGRPVDFRGAVGDFALEAYADPVDVKVGDPVVLRMTISGKGNLDTVTAPRAAPSEKFKLYEPEVTKKGGKKIYEQILIPKTDEAREIPEVSFSFFDPVSKKYKTVRKGPFPLKVVSQPEAERVVKIVSMPGVEEMFYPREELGEDIIHIKENIGKVGRKGLFVYRSPLFWAAQPVPLVLLGVFYAAYRKRERILRDKSYARFLKAPGKARRGLAVAKASLDKGDVLAFYDATFKTLQEYLSSRLDLSAGSVTARVVEDRIRASRGDMSVSEMLDDIFSACEMARYASSVPGPDEAKEVLVKVKKVIDYLERAKL